MFLYASISRRTNCQMTNDNSERQLGKSLTRVKVKLLWSFPTDVLTTSFSYAEGSAVCKWLNIRRLICEFIVKTSLLSWQLRLFLSLSELLDSLLGNQEWRRKMRVTCFLRSIRRILLTSSLISWRMSWWAMDSCPFTPELLSAQVNKYTSKTRTTRCQYTRRFLPHLLFLLLFFVFFFFLLFLLLFLLNTRIPIGFFFAQLFSG